MRMYSWALDIHEMSVRYSVSLPTFPGAMSLVYPYFFKTFQKTGAQGLILFILRYLFLGQESSPQGMTIRTNTSRSSKGFQNKSYTGDPREKSVPEKAPCYVLRRKPQQCSLDIINPSERRRHGSSELSTLSWG